MKFNQGAVSYTCLFILLRCWTIIIKSIFFFYLKKKKSTQIVVVLSDFSLELNWKSLMQNPKK